MITKRLLSLFPLLCLVLACNLAAPAPEVFTRDPLATQPSPGPPTLRAALTTQPGSPAPRLCSVAVNALNLRAGPGVEFAVKTVLAQGAGFTTSAPLPLQGWIFVKASTGPEGYLNSKFVQCERK